jgi:hypothetical protein
MRSVTQSTAADETIWPWNDHVNAGTQALTGKQIRWAK